MRENIILHIGQAGVQLSHAVWELACLEHNVGSDGRPMASECGGDGANNGAGASSLFTECSNGNFTPRALLIDLEPTVIGKCKRMTTV